MRRVHFLLMLPAAFTIAGCGVPSSEKPLFTDKEIVSADVFVGEWQSRGRTLDIKKIALTDSYSLAAGDELTRFYVLKLGDHYFIDLTRPDGYHEFSRVSLLGQRLSLHSISENWIKQHPTAVKHKIIRKPYSLKDNDGIERESFTEHVRLTATTKELQRFVLSNINDPKCFPGGLTELSAVQRLPVTESGLTSKKQRTFDYWYTLRAILLTNEPRKGTEPKLAAESYLRMAKSVDELPTLGVDEIAVDCALDVALTMTTYANAIKSIENADRLLESVVRGLFGDPLGVAKEMAAEQNDVSRRIQAMIEHLRRARARLTARYEMEFQKID